MEENKKYGLFTSITMIIGIVIGSGIFFKADDVLVYTNGNVLLGILIFIISAIAIIFGSLSIAQLAMRTDKPGGIISYAEEFINKETASSFGWFQVILYITPVTAIVGWVAAIYLFQLFGIEATLMQQVLTGMGIVVVIFILNILSAKLGGYFQNLAMLIKIIPLIVIAILGFVKGNPSAVLSQDLSNFGEVAGMGMLAAFGPIAFSFDGWIVSTTICNEIKNSKRNLPLALIISPIVVLIFYLLYFIGISVLVGPEEVLQLGNASVNKAAEIVFGTTGAKVMLTFVVISVLGTCNGLILGAIRMPYSLAIRKMIPFSDKLSQESKKLNGIPLNSALLALVLALIWSFINYFYIKSGLPGDISEIGICVSYINYAILYFAIIKLTKKGEIQNKIMGYFVPIMAIIGSLIILTGSMGNKLFILYLIICFVIMALGYFYTKNKK